ncbi:MAG TPA: glycosyltransferase family 4 protein [Mycobacteriales bacterium]|nr:glycosyltransferase family 4 protein [Mycobacteriales bacterium]
MAKDARLRVLLTHVFSWPEVRRGGERYLHELGAALVRAGHDVQILSTGPQASRDTVLGAPVLRLRRRELMPDRFQALAGEVGFGVQSLAWAAARPFDVWHALGTADAASATVLATVRRGLRTVFTDLGVPGRESRLRRPDRRLHRRVVDAVDHYLCLSEWARGYLEDGFGRPGEVMGAGIDLRTFAPGPRAATPTVLYSGSLVESRKNVPLLLEAVSLLRARIPDVRLRLSGPGDVTEMLAAAPADARAAVASAALDDRDTLGRLYASSWVTCLPSINEAFGLAIVESLASGTPGVVLRGGGGSAELMRDHAVLGAGDGPDALADTLAEAIELARDPETADRCREVAREHDWDSALVPRLLAMYRG